MRGAVTPRQSVRFAAVVAAALLAGVLPGTNSAASGAKDGLSLAYSCRFGTVQQDVTVAFTQTYPQTAQVGRPIQPGDLTMTVAIPRDGVGALLPAQSDTLGGSADLAAHVTQGTSTADMDWAGLTADSTPVAGAGDLDLAFAGKVPGVSVTAPGQVAFSVGDLALTLQPHGASPTPPVTPSAPATPTSSGSDGASATAVRSGAVPAGTPAAGTPAPGDTATVPGDVAGTCTVKPGQDTRLATVTVPGGPGGVRPPGQTAAGAGTGSPSGSSPSSSGGAAGTKGGSGGTITRLDAPVHSGRTTCDPPPHGDLDPKRLPPTNPGAIILPMPGMPPFPDAPMCGYAVGFSNVGKLNGAMIINDPHDHPSMADVNSGRRKVLDFGHDYVELDSLLSLTLPPSHSTFLTYGFMPTTAEVDFIPKGLMTVVQTGDDFYDQPILTTIGGYQDIRIHDVRINGTPLDVGPDCHTATPVDVVLQGRKRAKSAGGTGPGLPDYDIADGGPLVDENLTVPPFTGCGTHGDNLNALFTAALSGPGNTLNLSQGRLCDPINVPEQTCRPEIQIPPLPQRRR